MRSTPTHHPHPASSEPPLLGPTRLTLCFHQQGEVLYWGQCPRTGPRTAHSLHSLLGRYPPEQPQIRGFLGSPVVPLAQLSRFGPPALQQPLLPSAPGACTPAAESL